MLRVNAKHYVEAGEVFHAIDEVVNENNEPTPQLAEFIYGNLITLTKHCAVLRLPVTQEIIRAAKVSRCACSRDSQDLPSPW